MDFKAKKLYLFIYNTICLSGWSAVFGILVMFSSLTKSYNGLYYLVETLIQFFQTLALLEIIHAVFGLVGSNPIFVLLQVLGRLFIVWVTFYEPYQVTSDFGTCMLILAWSLTEIIRYLFYSWSIAHHSTVPYFLIWLRYSAFIILYPIGILGEVITTKSAFNYLIEWTLFPITYKSSIIYFSMSHLVLLLIIPYIFGCVSLYTYMLKQRKKVLIKARNYLNDDLKLDSDAQTQNPIFHKAQFCLKSDNGNMASDIKPLKSE